MTDYDEEKPTPKRPKPAPIADTPEPRAGKTIDDAQHGDAVNESTWLERRKEQTGWRNGARVRKP